MRATEIDQFEAKYGYKPTELRTSYDALAVYVHKDNPIEKLTLAQVEAIFSKSRKPRLQAERHDLGAARPDRRMGEPADQPLRPQLRQRHLRFFKEHALKNGDFKDTVKEQPGSASVVQGVTEDRFGIGYSRHRLPDVRRQGRAARRNRQGAVLGRQLRRRAERQVPAVALPLIYINKAPGKPMDPLVDRVREVDVQQGRPGGGRQGRLHAALRKAGRRGNRQGAVSREWPLPIPRSSVRARWRRRRPHRPSAPDRSRRRRGHHARRHRRGGRGPRHPGLRRQRGGAAVSRRDADAARPHRSQTALSPRDAASFRAVGVDEYRTYLYTVEPTGNSRSTARHRWARDGATGPDLGQASVTSTSRTVTGHYIAAGLATAE